MRPSLYARGRKLTRHDLQPLVAAVFVRVWPHFGGYGWAGDLRGGGCVVFVFRSGGMHCVPILSASTGYFNFQSFGRLRLVVSSPPCHQIRGHHRVSRKDSLIRIQSVLTHNFPPSNRLGFHTLRGLPRNSKSLVHTRRKVLWRQQRLLIHVHRKWM